MLDLTKIPQRFIERHGKEKIVEVTGQSVSLVSAWISKGTFPVTAVQALLEYDPDPIHEIKPLYETFSLQKTLMYLMPVSTAVTGKAMGSFARLYDKREMLYETYAYNAIHVARNVLAARFLRSPAEWSFWHDADNMHPCGDAEYFKREAELPNMPDTYAGLNTIFRLLWHKRSGKLPDANIVSVVYTGRKKGSHGQFSGGYTNEMRAMVRQGPRDRVIEREWSGFGGMLVNRCVFESIINTQGEEIRLKDPAMVQNFKYEYAFFHPESPDVPGEDVPMLRRALKAGHKTYVDFSLMSTHGLGERPYTYADV